MNKFDALHDDRTLRWCKYRYPDDVNSGEFTFDWSKDGFTWSLPSDKPLRTTNEIVSYIDANGNQREVQAEVKYYGMGHDTLWTIAIPNVVEAENECICESLL
jgi:hypothetical protein|nr:MAG TPA: Tripartite Tc toxins repeat [Caudoviricetes sp.]